MLGPGPAVPPVAPYRDGRWPGARSWVTPGRPGGASGRPPPGLPRAPGEDGGDVPELLEGEGTSDLSGCGGSATNTRRSASARRAVAEIERRDGKRVGQPVVECGNWRGGNVPASRAAVLSLTGCFRAHVTGGHLLLYQSDRFALIRPPDVKARRCRSSRDERPAPPAGWLRASRSGAQGVSSGTRRAADFDVAVAAFSAGHEVGPGPKGGRQPTRRP